MNISFLVENTKLVQMDKHPSNLLKKDETVDQSLTGKVSCQHCEFLAESIPDIVAHIVKKHTKKSFQCDFCEYKCSSKEELDHHLTNDHDGLSFLETFAQQQRVLLENFELFKGELTQTLNVIINEQNFYKQELLKLNLKQSTDIRLSVLEKSISMLTEEVKNTLTKTPIVSTSASTDEPSIKSVPKPEESKASITPPKPHSPTSNERKSNNQFTHQQSPILPVAPRKKLNVCLVGDSIAHNVDIKQLEKESNFLITKLKAYGSVEDSVSMFPKKNLSDVVPQELVRKYNQTGLDFDVLIIQASSTDITNLDTNVNAMENMEYLKQSAAVSSTNIFNVATDSLKHTNVKKVIIMERIPRYDRVEVDPSSLKSGLSEYSNGILHQLWLQSELKDKIIIGKHELECSANIRRDRYGNENVFDGIHLRGPSGKKCYTGSIINIIRKSEILTPQTPVFTKKPESSSTSPGSNHLIKKNGKSPTNHNNCEQTVFKNQNLHRTSNMSSNQSKPSNSSSKLNSANQHSQVFLNRGNIKDFYYSRNIFDIFNNVNNLGN